MGFYFDVATYRIRQGRREPAALLTAVRRCRLHRRPVLGFPDGGCFFVREIRRLMSYRAINMRKGRAGGLRSVIRKSAATGSKPPCVSLKYPADAGWAVSDSRHYRSQLERIHADSSCNNLRGVWLFIRSFLSN